MTSTHGSFTRCVGDRTAGSDRSPGAEERFKVKRQRKVRWVVECVFHYQCPRRWENLVPTGNPDVRHCGQCDRDVYFCDDKESFMAHVGAGHCIATLLTDGQGPGQVIVGEPDSGLTLK